MNKHLPGQHDQKKHGSFNRRETEWQSATGLGGSKISLRNQVDKVCSKYGFKAVSSLGTHVLHIQGDSVFLSMAPALGTTFGFFRSSLNSMNDDQRKQFGNLLKDDDFYKAFEDVGVRVIHTSDMPFSLAAALNYDAHHLKGIGGFGMNGPKVIRNALKYLTDKYNIRGYKKANIKKPAVYTLDASQGYLTQDLDKDITPEMVTTIAKQMNNAVKARDVAAIKHPLYPELSLFTEYIENDPAFGDVNYIKYLT